MATENDHILTIAGKLSEYRPLRTQRYAAVNVLLITWADHDFKPGFDKETDDLKDMFCETFRYDVWPYNIPSKDAERALNAGVAQFVKRFGDEDNLIIVFYNELLPLHIASWLGEDALVIRLLETTDPGVKSVLGFNAVHFACLGGHLSVLRILLEHNVPLVAADFRSITALHLAIFFPPADLALAVSLLLNKGCSLEAVT
ncbi:uncharacterized protein DNG_02224 [Cephalotrichum gorgonifer]|uniref:Ank_2 domain-containing protein n=1 Tax=Cephalotrichum gorgonifer TaxID=2041049 RepID=A0AAE8MS21_9PEZI|nr:uncharacterized protein DNG_02224 [Cephalotrichum gorgonifer]